LTQSFARSLGADCVNGPSVSLLYSRRRARPPTTWPPPSGRALPCSVGSERRSQLGRTASLSNSKLPVRPRSSERLTPVDRTSSGWLHSTELALCRSCRQRRDGPTVCSYASPPSAQTPASAATRYTGIIIEGWRAWAGRHRRADGCTGVALRRGITRRGWSGLRHLSRIVLVADARRRESWLAVPPAAGARLDRPGGTAPCRAVRPAGLMR
jgi:hypothetical protein